MTRHVIERDAQLSAARTTVFSFLSESPRFAAWFGAGSTIEPSGGGAVLIQFPGGIEVGGEVIDCTAPERLLFTYGFRDAARTPAWGKSLVQIELGERPQSTLLRLRHTFPDKESRDAHVDGWRYQIAVLANLAAVEQHAGLAAHVDAWFAAWSSDDAGMRKRILAPVTTDGVTFRDAWACVAGRDDLLAHITAAKRHMPKGLRIERAGEPRHVQGVALVDWRAVGADGNVAMRGTNAFDFAPDGRIARVVGFPA